MATLAKPFFLSSFSSLFVYTMTRANAEPDSSPTTPKSNYPWAPNELLSECTSLTSFQDLEAHRGDPYLYNFNAFCRTHDAHISVRPGRPGEPVCLDDRPRKGKPFFFMYQTVFKRVGVRLPFTPFERELLTEINIYGRVRMLRRPPSKSSKWRMLTLWVWALKPLLMGSSWHSSRSNAFSRIWTSPSSAFIMKWWMESSFLLLELLSFFFCNLILMHNLLYLEFV